MAGRPVKMARKAGELEAQALELAGQTYLAAPTQYHGDVNRQDTLGVAWAAAINATMAASIALENLGDLLREKAGIMELGPAARMLADDSEDAAQ